MSNRQLNKQLGARNTHVLWTECLYTPKIHVEALTFNVKELGDAAL